MVPVTTGPPRRVDAARASPAGTGSSTGGGGGGGGASVVVVVGGSRVVTGASKAVVVGATAAGRRAATDGDSCWDAAATPIIPRNPTRARATLVSHARCSPTGTAVPYPV